MKTLENLLRDENRHFEINPYTDETGKTKYKAEVSWLENGLVVEASINTFETRYEAHVWAHAAERGGNFL